MTRPYGYGTRGSLHRWFEIAPGLSDCMRVAYLTGDKLCPPTHLVFESLKYFYPLYTKVVVLGQDPYHTPGKANGLAFGYHDDYEGPVDSSMANILRELGIDDPTDFDRSLQQWSSQGVLLLNTCLTVDEGWPRSHDNMGWQQEISRILKFLVDNTDCLYMAWGAQARKVLDKVGVPENRMLVTSHPCRYSNTATNSPFTGSDCFNRINQMLSASGKKEIKWK